jgi:DNA-directed RNA polymerase subunit RPC12/RpoP
MNIHCPSCDSDVLYKYGQIAGGKKRFICLVCDRQFVVNSKNIHFKNKPRCPKCNKPTHAYMKNSHLVRFRCSDYPKCKTYLKTDEVEFEIVNVDMYSKEFSFEKLIIAMEGKPIWEVLHIANEEITSSERLLIKAKALTDQQQTKIENYIGKLTRFMLFLKSTTRISRTGKRANMLFWEYWDSINQEAGSGVVAEH